MEDRSTRAFKALLSLYPSGFRDEYGREIALMFEDRYRRAAGSPQRAIVWLESLGGLMREAPKEHGRVLAHDLRYALRALRTHPLFAATIVLTLSLGIGANTAIFSLINAVAFRDLPLTDPGQLLSVRIDSPTPVPQRFSWPQFEQLRSVAPTGSLTAMSRVARVYARVGNAGDLEPATTQLVSGEFFHVMKVPIAMGRPLGPEDNVTPGTHPVAVISHGYWQRRFGGDAGVLGSRLTMNGALFTIVGVAAEGFAGVWLESPVEIWAPIAMQHDIHYSQNYSASNSKPAEPWMPQEGIAWLDIVVRARTGSSTTMAAALDLAVRQKLLALADEQHVRPETRKQILQQHLALQPFGSGFSRLRERFLNPLYILMAMAGLVLLIACANAANLLLARATGRQRELAVRLSLGAGRLRLVQQLLTESLVLVLLAGASALVVSHWASALLVRMATATTDGPAPFAVETDLRVLSFTMALALVTTLLFGLAPALRSTRVDVTGTLKSGSRSVLGGGDARALVVFQVALSLVLVSAAGLLIRSFQNIARLDLGFDQQHVLTAELGMQLMPRKTPTPAQLAAFQSRLVEGVRGVPGTRSVSLAMCGVVRGCRSLNSPYSVEGYQAAPQEDVAFLINFVGTEYFDTMGMPVIEGRPIDSHDTTGSPRVALINEALARKYFAGQNAIGKRFGMDNKLDTEIVGVVRDARVLGVRDEPTPMVYYALAQSGQGPSVVEIRTQGDPRLAIASIRRALAEAAPEVPIIRLTPLSDQIHMSLSQDRLVLSLSSAFGVLALGLAGFGLFSILSFAVARRTAEFGIRIALGASGGRVLWSVCREALLIVLAGIAIGLPAVLFGSRALRTVLFGMTPHDWTAFAGAGAVLLVVAAVAGLLPAWRASRVDPVVALRME